MPASPSVANHASARPAGRRPRSLAGVIAATRLATRIYVGFGLLVLVVAAVGAVAFLALDTLSTGVADAEETGALVADFERSHSAQQDFVINAARIGAGEGTDAGAADGARVETAIADVLGRIDVLATRLGASATLDAIQESALAYDAAFADYRSLTVANTGIIAAANTAATEAAAVAEQLMASRWSSYAMQQSRARQATDEFRQVLALAAQANEILDLMQRTRAHESAWLITGNREQYQLAVEAVKALMAQAEAMRDTITDESSPARRRAISVVVSAKGYLSTIEALSGRLLVMPYTPEEPLARDLNDLAADLTEAVGGLRDLQNGRLLELQDQTAADRIEADAMLALAR
ncbi:MAG: hypothetical protein ACFCVH_16630, partial [Alphaproteobacteria bacterium]